MSMRTALARARGLGSAQEGVSHWWAQRVTAVALVPLSVWFVYSVVSLSGAGYEQVVAWLGSPFRAALLILFLTALFYHAALGMQVVIDDYVHHQGMRLAGLVVIKFALAVLAATAIVSVLRITVSA